MPEVLLLVVLAELALPVALPAEPDVLQQEREPALPVVLVSQVVWAESGVPAEPDVLPVFAAVVLAEPDVQLVEVL